MFVAIQRALSHGKRRCNVTLLFTAGDLQELLAGGCLEWLDRRSKRGEYFFVECGEADEDGAYDWFEDDDGTVLVYPPRPVLEKLATYRGPYFGQAKGTLLLTMRTRTERCRWRFLLGRCSDEAAAMQQLRDGGAVKLVEHYGTVVNASDFTRLAINEQN